MITLPAKSRPIRAAVTKPGFLSEMAARKTVKKPISRITTAAGKQGLKIQKESNIPFQADIMLSFWLVIMGMP
jgi:hypothetical protein